MKEAIIDFTKPSARTLMILEMEAARKAYKGKVTVGKYKAPKAVKPAR